MKEPVFWIGILAGACTSVSLLPQILKIIKEKKSENISIPYLLILFAGLCLWITYGVMKKDTPIIITNSLAAAMNVITIILGLMYRHG